MNDVASAAFTCACRLAILGIGSPAEHASQAPLTSRKWCTDLRSHHLAERNWHGQLLACLRLRYCPPSAMSRSSK
jgi:hypothetical protein